MKSIINPSRIISVADAFDAMSGDRPFRGAFQRKFIVDELRRFAGIQFDPDLVKEFLLILESGECDIDPELVADAVASTSQTTWPTRPTHLGARS